MQILHFLYIMFVVARFTWRINPLLPRGLRPPARTIKIVWKDMLGTDQNLQLRGGVLHFSLHTQVKTWENRTYWQGDAGGLKVCLKRYSWGAGKVGSEYSSWFIRLECISCPVQICMQIGLKMEAGDCRTLNMNAKENYLLSHSLSTGINWNFYQMTIPAKEWTFSELTQSMDSKLLDSLEVVSIF